MRYSFVVIFLSWPEVGDACGRGTGVRGQMGGESDNRIQYSTRRKWEDEIRERNGLKWTARAV